MINDGFDGSANDFDIYFLAPFSELCKFLLAN